MAEPLVGYASSLTPAAILLGTDPNPGAIAIHPVIRAIAAQCIQVEHLRDGAFQPTAVMIDIALEICHRISQLGTIVSEVISDESGVPKFNYAGAAHELWVQGGFIPDGIQQAWRGGRCDFSWECPTVADILGCADSGVPPAEWPHPQQLYFPRVVREGLAREYPPPNAPHHGAA